MSQTKMYPMIVTPDRGESYTLLSEEGGVSTHFDEIEATRHDYWELRFNGREVGTVDSLENWPDETVRRFQDIQTGKVVA